MSASKCIRNGCLYKRREGMEYCCVRCSNDKGHGPLCASNQTNDICYTIQGKRDGFGAQYQAIMSGIAYCEKTNSTYVHTPFQEIAHGCNPSRANNFVGIHTQPSKAGLSKIVAKKYFDEVHYCKNPSEYYTDKVLEKLRKFYYLNEKPFVGDIDIAIHIRRGDVGKHFATRYTDNDVYIQFIQQFKRKYPEYTIVIFSEGKYQDFKHLGLGKECFRLNLDVFETFHSLVSAKVLVQAKSSFSYCAGLLNANTVYWMNGFWHKKLDHWLETESLLVKN